MAEAGFVQFNTWIKRNQRPELLALIAYLKANPETSIVSVSLQDAKTGRMKGVRLK